MVIGIYPRKSVYRDNSDSIKVQIQMCREYAEILFRGKELEFRIYDKDEGFSGKNTNRPGFRELMSDVAAGLLDVVIVYKLDRISRNVREFSAMYEVFQQHNVAFVSVKESFDTSTPMGRTVMYILAAFAQLERENTSERVADNMHALGSSGKWTGGRCPPGMKPITKESGGKKHSWLVVDEENIFRVKLVFQLLLQGNSITRVERYCRDHGITTQSGKYFGSSQIYNIITNPVYCQNAPEAYEYFNSRGCELPDPSLFDGKYGLIGYGRTKTGSSSQNRQDYKNWSISVGIHAPVIPAADWISAQQRLGVNKMYKSSKYKIGILKGVLRCKCGSRMDVRTYTKNGLTFSYYFCARRARQGKQACDSEYVRVQLVEEAFLRELRSIRLLPDSFSPRMEASPEADVQTIRSEIQKTERSIENLTAALTQAMDSPAAAYIISQIEKLDRQKRTLESTLFSASRRQEEERARQASADAIFQNICYLLDNFDQIDYTGKNELIRKTVKSCILDGKNLRIIF